jgi:Flp pilus assembly protein TadG
VVRPGVATPMTSQQRLDSDGGRSRRRGGYDVTRSSQYIRTARSRKGEERGQALVLLVLTLTVLLGFAALTIDIGRAYYSKRSLQASADAAALAGAQGLPNSTTAQSLANQYSGSAGSKNARSNLQNVDTTVSVKCLYSGSSCSSPNAITVSQHAQVGSLFAKVLGINVFDVGAKATACSLGATYASLVDDNATSCPFTPAPCVIGYPFSSSNPRTSQTFNESEVLRGFAPQIAGPGDTIKVWYNDEHALTLGIRQVVIKTSKTASTATDYPVTPLSSNPGMTLTPAVGATDQTGEQSGTDPVFRPAFPALFVTDLTNSPTSKAGDWQYNGTPIAPDAVFGTWKAAVKTVDKSRNPALVTVTPDADPTKNSWNLGPGSDPAPSGLTNQGYGAEARWDIDSLGLQVGHPYRLQFMVHDGDQNSGGGDAGQNCMTVFIPH